MTLMKAFAVEDVCRSHPTFNPLSSTSLIHCRCHSSTEKSERSAIGLALQRQRQEKRGLNAKNQIPVVAVGPYLVRSSEFCVLWGDDDIRHLSGKIIRLLFITQMISGIHRDGVV